MIWPQHSTTEQGYWSTRSDPLEDSWKLYTVSCESSSDRHVVVDSNANLMYFTSASLVSFRGKFEEGEPPYEGPSLIIRDNTLSSFFGGNSEPSRDGRGC